MRRLWPSLLLCVACRAAEPGPEASVDQPSAPPPAVVPDLPREPAPSEAPPSQPPPSQSVEPQKPALPPGVACTDGWCSFSAYPLNGRIRELVSDGTNVWLVDDLGRVHRWDGRGEDPLENWSSWDVGGEAIAVWADSETAVVVAVDDASGYVARFADAEWTKIPNDQISGGVEVKSRIDGVSGGPVFVTGKQQLLRLDGNELSVIEMPPEIDRRFLNIAVISADELWITDTSAWRYAHGTWKEHRITRPKPGQIETWVKSVDASGPKDVWAVKDDLFRWNGKSWRKQRIDYWKPYIYVYGPNDVIAANGDEVAQWNGKSWSLLTDLHGYEVARLDDRRIVIADDVGALVISDGVSARRAHRSFGLDVRDVWVGEHTTWLVGGDEGTQPVASIARYDDREQAWRHWTLETAPAIAVAGVGDEPWLVTANNEIWHLVGDAWQLKFTRAAVFDPEFEYLDGGDIPRGLAVGPAGDPWIWGFWFVAHRVGDTWEIVVDPKTLGDAVMGLSIAPDGTVLLLQKSWVSETRTLRRASAAGLETLGETTVDVTEVLALGHDSAILRGSTGLMRWNTDGFTAPAELRLQDWTLVEGRPLGLDNFGNVLDLDYGERTPTPYPGGWSRIHGGASGQLWVQSRADNFVFRE